MTGGHQALLCSTLNIAGHNSMGLSVNIVLRISHLLTSLQQEGGHWAFFHCSALGRHGTT